MKTAEEFLDENGISFSQTSKDVFGNELLKLMEQFRKEGMEEAYEAGKENMETYLEGFETQSDDLSEDVYCEDFTLDFEEWYNNQIK